MTKKEKQMSKLAHLFFSIDFDSLFSRPGKTLLPGFFRADYVLIFIPTSIGVIGNHSQLQIRT